MSVSESNWSQIHLWPVLRPLVTDFVRDRLAVWDSVTGGTRTGGGGGGVTVILHKFIIQ